MITRCSSRTDLILKKPCLQALKDHLYDQGKEEKHLASSRGYLLKNVGRREPGNIHKKSCWLLPRHHSCDQHRTSNNCDLIRCYAISVLYLVALQAIYNFVPRLCDICSCVEFREALCTCKLRDAKYGEQVSPTNQLQQLWSRTLWTCAFSVHPKTVFHQPLRCSLRLPVHFWVNNFCWVDKMSRAHVVSFCNLIGIARARGRKSTAFPADVTRLSPPHVFWGESLGTRLKGTLVSSVHCSLLVDGF